MKSLHVLEDGASYQALLRLDTPREQQEPSFHPFTAEEQRARLPRQERPGGGRGHRAAPVSPREERSDPAAPR